MQKIFSFVSSSMSTLKAIDLQTKLDVFWIGVIQAANYLFPFVATTYLVRTIGVDLYGKTEFATYIILYFITLVNYELHITGTRSFSRVINNQAKTNQLFSIIFTSKTYLLALSALLFSLLPILWPGKFFNLLFLFTYLIVIGHFFYQPHIFQGFGKVRTLAIMNLLIKAISTGLLFLIIRSPKDYQLVNLNYSLSYILIGTISYLLALKMFRIDFQWKKRRTVLLFLKSGFYIFLTSGVIAQITLNLSAILLGFFLPLNILGSYSAAIKIIIAFQVMILLPLRQVFFPKLSSYWAFSRQHYRKIFKTYALLMGGSTFILGVLILLFAPFIIKTMYGNYYAKMIFCMRMLAFLPFVTAMNNVFINDGLIISGKDKLVFQIQSSIALINVITLLIMVPKFGLTPVLITRNVLELSACFAGFLFFRNKVMKEWNKTNPGQPTNE